MTRNGLRRPEVSCLGNHSLPFETKGTIRAMNRGRSWVVLYWVYTYIVL
jgi:hypothetical protein